MFIFLIVSKSWSHINAQLCLKNNAGHYWYYKNVKTIFDKYFLTCLTNEVMSFFYIPLSNRATVM